jgi:selenide,water dikinase
MALVQSVDFFTPIVDDPAAFGRIAAANALSDLYAMGARPLFALALAAWPRELDLDLFSRVLEGGASKAAEAGCPVVGGHTIDDPEPKYGLAVTGIASPDALWRNAGGRAGDELYLTKPLGTGVISTAVKSEAAPPEVIGAAVASMERLNRDAADAAREAGPSAVTDVTGFGLCGHLHELAAASGVSAELDHAALPWLPGVRALAEAGQVAGGSRRNLEAALDYATFADGLDELDRILVCDAQTSGGLLVALGPERAGTFRQACAARAVPAVRIGRLAEGPAGSVLVS